MRENKIFLSSLELIKICCINWIKVSRHIPTLSLGVYGGQTVQLLISILSKKSPSQLTFSERTN